MTGREAYVFGWCFGAIVRQANDEHIGGDLVLAAQRPYSASAKILTEARRRGMLHGDFDLQIGEAMAEIVHFPDEVPEPYLPLEMQGSWQIGYFAGKAGAPLAHEDFDIQAARKAAGLTQAELADLIGAGQYQISRWETGRVKPNRNHLDKIKAALSCKH